MHPAHLSLVIGSKGCGLSTLLKAFGERADTEGALIIDEGHAGLAGQAGQVGDGLPETWDSVAIAAWLKRHQRRANNIVLASSDLRAPRHLLQALANDPVLAATFRLSSLTYAIDTSDAKNQVEAASPAGRAVAIADRIVLTKTDRAEPDAVKRLAAVLKAQNPPAPILRARNGDIGPARLVDSGLFDPVTNSVDIDRWLCEAAFNFETTRRGGGGASRPSEVKSTLGRSAVRFFAITIDQPLDGTVLSVFLKLLMADRGTDLLRLKGIVATEDHPDRPALIDGREHLIQPLLWLPAWPTADHRSRLVFSTTNFSETWIRTLLTTLCDQLKLAETPALQLAGMEAVG